MKARKILPLVLLLALVCAPAQAQRFHPSDPMMVDDDRLVPVSEQPEELDLSDLYDRFGHIFNDFGDPDFSEARNVNTLDELPDSSWFTNRIGVREMSLEELARGPDTGSGPDTEGIWQVFKGKSQGLTPGFLIEDSRGDRYVIKLDPFHIPELATAAEAIATKIFHALGYNVPQNYIVRYDPERLEIKPGTMVSDSYGEKKDMTPGVLRGMLRRVPRDADGKIRVVASKYFDGLPLGPFRYYGVRMDDPNDVILHEHRRELRGLRLFAAWTNHDDTRAQNTQDSWARQDGKHCVKHWLMDFGSTFGSGSVDLQAANLGYEPWMDLRQLGYYAAGFGFRVPAYRRVKFPAFPEYLAVGRFESEAFDPEGWRNDYSNPAFVRMTRRDAFWAAKILMRFTPEQLLAMVETGQFSNPEHARYFHQVLLERQHKSGRFGINGLNPLDGFRVAGSKLVWDNLSEAYDFAESGSTSYRVSWHLFDNRVDLLGEAIVPASTQTASWTKLPSLKHRPQPDNLFLVARIESVHPDHPHWADPVLVYLRPSGDRFEVVGIERTAAAEYIGMD